MLNKKIHIYCSNSYETLVKEYPDVRSHLLDYNSWSNTPRGIKEICESFMELLNRDELIVNVWTISDIPINIMGNLIAENIFNHEDVKLTFIGIDENTNEIIKREAGYTVGGFGNDAWPFGAMSSWYGFYKPGKDKLREKSLKNEK